MHQAVRLQFARVMDELALWRGVPDRERSPAPAWWWGPAMAVLDLREPLPRHWCDDLGLRGGASVADGARTILALFTGQTSLPWPSDFPRKSKSGDHAERDLHPLPSDDSAFQP